MRHFSVVTIVRNDLEGLKRTQASLLAQTCSDYEWIVVDGASTDGTKAYVLSLSGDFVNAVSEADSGIYDAMNKGLSRATGAYVVFMNAGDCFGDERVLEQVKSVCGDFDFIYGDSADRFEDGRLQPKRARGHEMLHYGMFGCHQTMYYRTCLAQSVGFDTTFRVSGDYAFTARLLSQTSRIYRVNACLALFDMTGISNRNEKRGRIENWRVQRDVLRLGLGLRSWIRAQYLAASFARRMARPLYDWLRQRYV